MTTSIKRVLLAIGSILVVGFILLVLDLEWWIELTGNLVFGWVAFLIHVMPKVQFRWDMFLSFVVCGVIFLVGTQQFLKWVHREIYGPPAHFKPAYSPWKFRWTLSAFLLVLLMFTAGMGAVGVVHQSVWLARSPHPIFHRYRGRLDCARNLNQLDLALSAYRVDHAGKNPDNLAQLVTAGDVTASSLVCPVAAEYFPAAPLEAAGDVKSVLPEYGAYIYLGKGMSEPISPNTPLVIEPLEYHNGTGIHVLYGNGRLEWLAAPEANAILMKFNAPPQATSQPADVKMK